MIFSSTSLSKWLAATAAISAAVTFSNHGQADAFHPVSLTTARNHHRLVSSSPGVSLLRPNPDSSRPLTVMYRIRCENKYYQLEELEDSDNCTTELFLKEDGTVDILETDGPIFDKAEGNWEVEDNHFVMSITKTFVTGTDNKKDPTGMGEFKFQVERLFEGDLTVVGGTEVAINGKIFADDIITEKFDKEVGFFNMIDGTEVRLERRADARPKDIGVIPSPIDSNDVKGHDGIPKEWLQPQEPAMAGGISEYGGGGFGQDALGYGGGGGSSYGQQSDSAWASGSAGSGYTVAAPPPQQPEISEYGGGSFGQESQVYGGSGYGQEQHGSTDPGPPSFADWGQPQAPAAADPNPSFSDWGQPQDNANGGENNYPDDSQQSYGGGSGYDYNQGDYRGNGGISPM